MAADIPSPPKGTAAAGRKVWRSVVTGFELDEWELLLLRELARTTDRLDVLDGIVAREGLMIDSPTGVRTHPAETEARQQRIVAARLIVALRLPAGSEGDEVEGRRPQRRGGARGVYRPSAATLRSVGA